MFSFEKKKDEDAYILTAVSGEPVHAQVAAVYEGLPVTAIGKYAFSGQRQLESIELPKSVSYIGTHAFYNCRGLKEVHIHGHLTAVEDGAFKNCKKLHHIYMENMQHLDLLLNNISTEVTVHLHLAEAPDLILLFPEYDFTYQEFVQPRLYDLIPFGSGSYFRMSAGVKSINFTEYDKAFVYSKLHDQPATSITLALYRLLTPYQLSDEAKTKYLDFLREHTKESCRLALDRADTSFIETLLKYGLLDEERISDLIARASAEDKPEAVSILMEHKLSIGGMRKRRFSL